MIFLARPPASVTVQRRLCGQKEHHEMKHFIKADELGLNAFNVPADGPII